MKNGCFTKHPPKNGWVVEGSRIEVTFQVSRSSPVFFVRFLGTEAWSEEELQSIITRDSMIGSGPLEVLKILEFSMRRTSRGKGTDEP